MKLNKTMLILLAGISLFVGFILFSVSGGTLFPSIHTLTAALLCNGEVQVESAQPSQPTIYCITNGTRSEITIPAIGVTGLAASLIVFVMLVIISMILMMWMQKKLTGSITFGKQETDSHSEEGTASSGVK